MNRLRQSRWHQYHAMMALLVFCITVLSSPAIAFQAGESTKRSQGEKLKAESAESATQPVTAIVGATVVTMGPAGTLKNATILIQGEEILDVGVALKIPQGATRIDAAGMTLTPGLIDCRSSLWLTSDSIGASASDGSLNALDGVDPFSDSWREVASQGITTVCVGPKGSLGGQSVVLRVAPGTSTNELVVKKSASMQASLGLSGSSGNSKDRYAQYEALKKTFDSVKAYKEAWKKYDDAIKKIEKDKAGSEKADTKKSDSKNAKEETKPEEKPDAKASESSTSDKPEDKKSETPKKPKKDAVKEVLVQVLNKELPLRIEARRADDIANAMRLARDFDLTVTFEGASNAGRAWERLTSQHPALIAGPFCDFEATSSYANSKTDRYGQLKSFDGLIAIATFSKDSRASRLLRFHAAAAVNSGLTEEKALKAITIDAARVLGIEDETGSIEKGKKADLLLAGGNPIDPAAPVMLSISHGEIVYRNDKVKPSSGLQIVDGPKLDGSLPDSFALTSERILYPTGKLEPGAVLVREGKIVAVRKAKSKTGDLKVIDVGAAVVTPGLVVGHFSDVDVETTGAISASVRAIDSLSPGSTALKSLSRQGFTTVMYAPDSESVVAGQIGCVRIDAAEQIVKINKKPALPASKFVLSGDSRSTDRYPASLSGQLDLLQQYFEGSASDTSLYLPVAARTILEAKQNEILQALKDKSTVSVLEAATATEVDAAVKIASQHNLQALILNPNDLKDSIAELKALKAGVVIRPMAVTDHDWYVQDIAAASRAGLKLSLSGTDGLRIRQTLAAIVNAGMPPEAALRALTSDAADNYKLKTIGKLAKGNFADIVIWDGSPLNPAARPIHVIVDGVLTKDVK